MHSSDAIRFVRVIYDDRRDFPWTVVWGVDHVWRSCREKFHADDACSELRGILSAYEDWLAARAAGG